MLDLNKRTKTKPKPTLIFKNTAYVCAYHCTQLSYTTVQKVMIIFLLILQTVIIAQMLSGTDRDRMLQQYHALHSYMYATLMCLLS